MLSLKAKDITKSVILAAVATLLCLVFISLSWDLFSKAVSFAIVKTSIIDYRVRILAIILKPERTSFIVSGLLTGVFIGFASKNNRMLTTIFTLLLITIVFIIAFLVSIHWYGKNSLLIRFYLSCLHLVLLEGCAFLGVWFVSRRNRKTGQKSLPGGKGGHSVF